VCPKERAEDVKKLVAAVMQAVGNDYA